MKRTIVAIMSFYIEIYYISRYNTSDLYIYILNNFTFA